MKQSLLDSLKSAPVDTAKTIVKNAGYKVRLISNGGATIAVAFPDTIILYHKNGAVELAVAGDPCEVDGNE